MNNYNYIRYIFHNLDAELVEDIEKNNPDGLKMLCILYTLELQLEKEKYKTSSIHVDTYQA
jgi:hypothetical protein|tara:strand:+ start:304 stop:486 length:183 start_codon:yes stop_codon:yes gene_type:complete